MGYMLGPRKAECVAKEEYRFKTAVLQFSAE